jgi:hypothetical protein
MQKQVNISRILPSSVRVAKDMFTRQAFGFQKNTSKDPKIIVFFEKPVERIKTLDIKDENRLTV